MATNKVALPGSQRSLAPQAIAVGLPNPTDLISVTVILRRRHAAVVLPNAPRVSRADFAKHYGADPSDVAKIEHFAAENDLSVAEVSLARRSVQLAGTVANMSEAFGTELGLFQSPNGLFRGRIGHLFVPADLATIVVSVHGLDERPQARAQLRRSVSASKRASNDISYTPNAVAALYNYPSATGAGETVGIIELGGGYKSGDLKTYFKGLDIKTPKVSSVSVDGSSNQPAGDPNSADGEVLLDIEVIGAIAPGAKIVVYFAPNTDQGFLDAITTAIHDDTHKPSVISISWGGAESTWTQQSLTSYDQAFQDAAALGVTVCVASGDDGSNDGQTDGLAHVDFPASSPNVLGCGGTRLESSDGVITSETVWNEGSGNGAGGGGVSEFFPLPSYQVGAGVPVSVNPSQFQGRGVPDVAGDADPATGYEVRVDSTDTVFGGTSAVAPLWAALVAILNEELGAPLGFLNPTLYAEGSGDGTNDIVSGNNGAYTAGPGWDPCTGLGSPKGAQLLALLGGGAGPQASYVVGR